MPSQKLIIEQLEIIGEAMLQVSDVCPRGLDDFRLEVSAQSARAFGGIGCLR
jgi:hypothetical protein